MNMVCLVPLLPLNIYIFILALIILQMTTISRFENSEHAASYAKFRPVYPKTVANMITSFMKTNGSSGFKVAVDVACGSGQSTFLLCDYFEEVTGFDISEAQIAQAKLKLTEEQLKSTKHCVQFEIGDAHNLPLESSSVDLLTCAQAWHWLDAELFYAEAKRVLKPKGCLAVYGHGATITDNKRMKNAFDTFNETLIQSDCITQRNMHILNMYEAVKLPFPRTQRLEFPLPQKSTMLQLFGFMSSVSAYRSYCEKFPENTLLKNIQGCYEKEKSKCPVEDFTYPGFLILGLND